ncbi:hypothetical protein ACFU6K_36735 [Kitasatospora sp. NPDC057512]|uniref:hypothetical protein n=1 Tax=Kitasatospora sp. NPDC057512 TaxID=3346154 RepID=UPI0036B1D63A
MNGADLHGPYGPYGPGEGGHDDEQELRILLHRAVPALGSPQDRMERVLARVERSRRRRRAAGLAAGLTAGLTAAVLAAAPALAPAPVRGAATGPAGSVSAPVLSPPAAAPTVSPAPTVPGGPSAGSGATVFFPRLPEMLLDPPANWHALATSSADPRERFGYLGTQPLGAAPSCTAGAVRCPLSGRLAVDGAVLAFRLVDDQGLAEKLGPTPTGLGDTALDKECAALGGDRELTGLRTVERAGPAAVVEVTACLRQASDPTLRQTRQAFDSVRSAPPGGRPPGPTGRAATP